LNTEPSETALSIPAVHQNAYLNLFEHLSAKQFNRFHGRYLMFLTFVLTEQTGKGAPRTVLTQIFDIVTLSVA
jgi:hypothetical protein